MGSSTERQIELINKALEIMIYRASQENRSVDSKTAYISCIDMIRYALDENEECLEQFNYFTN